MSYAKDQQAVIYLYQHACDKLQRYGLRLVPCEEGFAVENVSNPKLSSTRLTVCGTLEGVNAWISGVESGLLWGKENALEGPK